MSSKKNNIQKFTESLSRLVEEFVYGKGYLPMKAAEIEKHLAILPEQRPIFQKVLSSLLKNNLIEVKKGRICPVAEEEIVTGIIRVHPRGFGFLQPEEKEQFPEEVFIPKHLTKGAVDGDRVEVIIDQESVSEKGPEGKVHQILRRGRSRVAGTITHVFPDGASAYVPLLGASQAMLVRPSEERLFVVGDRIILKVNHWGSEQRQPEGEMASYIGHISDPSCDIVAAVEEYELDDAFSSQALLEAKQFGSKVSSADTKGREDLRETECITIDPDTAKDFDDAVSLHIDERGHYHLGVHIADVSHYVRPGTALDQEARDRCNSVYFPGTVVPMLPHELSSHLCSLKANVSRLTVSVLMEFGADGTLLKHRIARSVIKSAKRFSYREAKEVLDGLQKSKHAPTLLLMVDLCHRLKRKRYERGSIEFALPDVSVRVDEKGNTLKIELVEYDITHQLIEEFMLKANEVVATHLSEQGKPLTYRVHEEPSAENIKEFAAIARAFGFALPDVPTAQELQELFDQARHSPYGEFLATSFIRSMKLATYAVRNIGHYGLGLEHYCHFTSPIRRYIDLIVHRVLCDELSSEENLDKIALQCSEKERLSAKAENAVVLLKKLRFVQAEQKKDPRRQYEGIITTVKPFGFVFEIPEFLLEGFLHISRLDNDYFVFDEKRRRLKGSGTGITYSCGDKITVMIETINLITLEAKWHLIVERRTRKKQRRRS